MRHFSLSSGEKSGLISATVQGKAGLAVIAFIIQKTEKAAIAA
jgi:hypothetical protein